mmetsp:Transcript_343/g.668  ORF Transcript_343/g.668 Transcript_343/m.668 type:complete len:225 (+) Transcript_343:3289-3963(+)
MRARMDCQEHLGQGVVGIRHQHLGPHSLQSPALGSKPRRFSTLAVPVPRWLQTQRLVHSRRRVPDEQLSWRRHAGLVGAPCAGDGRRQRQGQALPVAGVRVQAGVQVLRRARQPGCAGPILLRRRLPDQRGRRRHDAVPVATRDSQQDLRAESAKQEAGGRTVRDWEQRDEGDFAGVLCQALQSGPYRARFAATSRRVVRHGQGERASQVHRPGAGEKLERRSS